MNLSNLEEAVRLKSRLGDICKQINDIADFLAMRGRFDSSRDVHVSLTLNLAGERITVSQNFDIDRATNVFLLSLRRSRADCEARLRELGVRVEGGE